MSTLGDLDEHRLIVFTALGFVVLGAIVHFRRIGFASPEEGAFLVLVPVALVVFILGVAISWWAFAGRADILSAPVAGGTCVLAWLTGIQLRNRQLKGPLRALLVRTFLLIAGFLWTRDTPPSVGASAAARAFESHLGTKVRYGCRRFVANEDDALFGLSKAQFRCDPVGCRLECSRWYIAVDEKGRIRTADAPGAP